MCSRTERAINGGGGGGRRRHDSHGHGDSYYDDGSSELKPEGNG